MKKFILSIVAIIYLAASTGAAVNVHYCMGKMADWSLGHKNSKTCNFCGMKNSTKTDNGCCKDEHKFVKNEKDQKTADSFLIGLKQPVAESPLHETFFNTGLSNSIIEDYPVSNSPPRSADLPIYLSKRTFLI